MAGKQNRPWTEEDDHRLLELRAAGRSAASISAALKRSAGAIKARPNAGKTDAGQIAGPFYML